MAPSTIHDAISLVGGDGSRLLVATAAADGMPHVATADELAVSGDGRVAVAGWFCHRTVSNLADTSRLAVLAIDRRGEGYQIGGRVHKVEDLVMLDGWSPELAGGPHRPTGSAADRAGGRRGPSLRAGRPR